MSEYCTKRVGDRTCGSYAVSEHPGSNRCDRCWQEDRAEKAEARCEALSAQLLDADMLHLADESDIYQLTKRVAELEGPVNFALRERDLWQAQCLTAEEMVRAYQDVFANCLPVHKEFKSNYSPPMIRLRWALDCPTKLDRAVRSRA